MQSANLKLEIYQKKYGELMALDEINRENVFKKIETIHALLGELDNESIALNKQADDIRKRLEHCKIELINKLKQELEAEYKTLRHNDYPKMIAIEENLERLKKLCRLSHKCKNLDQAVNITDSRSKIKHDISNLKQTVGKEWYKANPKISQASRRRGMAAAILTGVGIGLLAFPPTGLAALIGGGVVAIAGAGYVGVGCAVGTVIAGAFIGFGAAKKGYSEAKYKGGILNGLWGAVKGAMIATLVAIPLLVISILGGDVSNVPVGGSGSIFDTDLKNGYKKAKAEYQQAQNPQEGVSAATPTLVGGGSTAKEIGGIITTAPDPHHASPPSRPSPATPSINVDASEQRPDPLRKKQSM